MKIRHQFGLFAFIFGTYLGFMYMFLTELEPTLYDVLSEAFSNINHLPFNVSDECIDVVRYLDPGGDPKVVDLFLNKHAGKYPYIHLINYPNAVRVFHKMYHVLKHQFTFKRKVFELASQFVDLVGLDLQYEIPNPIFVGIHVRRIAYDHHLQITQNGSLVEVEYFKRAITALQDSLNLTNENAMNRMVFFVTSDDEKWCKRVFFDIEAVLFFPSDFYRKMPVVSKAHFDLCIMSLCNHSIYDYGTFGFWGAYLAGGHTILAHNIGTGNNTEVETIKQANLPNWHFIDAHPPPVEPKPDYSSLYRRV
ncbi:hypothetical protein TCAL_05746 [Tigriopus californicus]|uniref:L-Fucosyltransferase n=1 Tax=Tigriopus californicus TaxID=6832 RepID=A0A553N898_TIGCA|nr:hypothetical protein TCAL_05746 [Tigriopus californicus]